MVKKAISLVGVVRLIDRIKVTTQPYVILRQAQDRFRSRRREIPRDQQVKALWLDKTY